MADTSSVTDLLSEIEAKLQETIAERERLAVEIGEIEDQLSGKRQEAAALAELQRGYDAAIRVLRTRLRPETMGS